MASHVPPASSSRSATPVDDTPALAAKVTPDPEKEQGAPPPNPAFDIPDGGTKAWMTVAGAWLVLFSTFGYVNAFGVYQEYYAAHFLQNKNNSDISWIGSFQLALMFGMSSITGKLHDEGYTKWLLAAGSLIYVLCLMMVSLAKEYYSIFLAQALGLGVGIGLVFLPSIGAVSHHFRRRRALANGIVVSGSSVGGICFPIMLNNLFEQIGFEWAVRASAFLILGCLIVANVLITTRLPPRRLMPEHMRVKPDMKGILTDVPYLITQAGVFFIVMGVFFPFFYLQVFAASKGLSQNLSFYSLAILNAASVFGRVLPNFLADYFGPMNLMIPCVFISAAFMWILLACGNPAGIVCFAIFFGFFSGAYISLLPSVNASFARGLHEIGIRMGLPFALLSIGALVGTPITGALIGEGPDFAWWKGSTFSGCCCMAGTALVFIARMMQAKRKGTQKV